MYSKEQMSKYQKAYYKIHREKIIKKISKWREKHADKLTLQRAVNYANNKNKICKTQKTNNWIKNGLNESDVETMYDKYCNLTSCEKCVKNFTHEQHRILNIEEKLIICRSCYYKNIHTNKKKLEN